MTKKVTKKSFAASPFTKKVRALFLNVHYAKAIGIAALQQLGFGVSRFRGVIAENGLVEVSLVSGRHVRMGSIIYSYKKGSDNNSPLPKNHSN